jgi:hypothetical protein
MAAHSVQIVTYFVYITSSIETQTITLTASAVVTYVQTSLYQETNIQAPTKIRIRDLRIKP